MIKFLNKHKPLLFSIALISFLLTAWIGTSRADDFKIICKNSCSGPSQPLFSEANMAPGQSAVKTLEIENQRNKPIDAVLSGTQLADTDKALLNTVEIIIKQSNEVKYQDNLINFLSEPGTTLGEIGSNSTQEYEISLYFKKESGNEYQDKKAKFDLKVNISGEEEQDQGEEEEETNDIQPTATPNPTEDLTDDIDDNDTNDDVAENDTPAEDAAAEDDVDAEDDTTAETTPAPQPAVLGEAIYAPATFAQEVILYEAEDETEEDAADIDIEFDARDGEILGEMCEAENYWWWLPLVIQLVLGIIYAVKLKKEPGKFWQLPLLLLAALSQLGHIFIWQCNCATGAWCTRYAYLNLAVLLMQVGARFLLNDKKKSADI